MCDDVSILSGGGFGYIGHRAGPVAVPSPSDPTISLLYDSRDLGPWTPREPSPIPDDRRPHADLFYDIGDRMEKSAVTHSGPTHEAVGGPNAAGTSSNMDF